MAKNSVDAYGAEGKTNLLTFDPDRLVLVTDPASPLYDSRVHLPISEPMVLNIMHQGVLQPIVVAKNTETGETEVVAGRQRVKNAREANTRLRAQGLEPISVPAVPRRENGVTLAGLMVSENEIREADSPLGRAEKMAKLMGLGRTEADLAVLFGCTTATVANTLALLDCTKGVQKAIQTGSIGVGHALALSKMEPAEQKVKLDSLVEVSASTTGHEKARKQREVLTGKPAVAKMRTRKEVLAKLYDYEPSDPVREILEWVLGDK